jgi:Ni,Fe-hydrogenase maturation factor
MDVYVFGNEDVPGDNISFKIVKKLKDKLKQINFIIVKPNEDLPFAGEKKRVVILDTVEGLEKITEITDIDKFVLPPRSTVHDFDLSFQLKYLKKIGHLGEVHIIGLPMQEEKINYFLIQSILRKLVAQDMHGS